MEIPAISVVMSAYNAAPFLKECIDSILTQTFEDFELIVVDDGSTDHSVEIIQSYTDTRIRLIKSEHNYIQSLNKGIGLAKGKYVARMDADDIMFPERLEEEFNFMEEHPDIDVCGSYVKVFNGQDIYSLPMPIKHNDIAATMVIQCPFYHPTVMLRMEKIRNLFFANDKCCLYDAQYKYGEDYALWVKLLKHNFRFGGIPKALLYYRISNQQITSAHKDELNAFAKQVRIEMNVYAESVVKEQASEEINSYYNRALEMAKRKVIKMKTLTYILSDLYCYCLNGLNQ